MAFKNNNEVLFLISDLITSDHPELLTCRSFQVGQSNTSLVSTFIGMTCIDEGGKIVIGEIQDTFLVT